mmetsp:Transcript_118972/g.379380  ORF Transcript_118972/g.379380 Transcript_118972/m.379380 type:complete len:201 (-) Transcript_118972:59-661(-)
MPRMAILSGVVQVFCAAEGPPALPLVCLLCNSAPQPTTARPPGRQFECVRSSATRCRRRSLPAPPLAPAPSGRCGPKSWRSAPCPTHPTCTPTSRAAWVSTASCARSRRNRSPRCRAAHFSVVSTTFRSPRTEPRSCGRSSSRDTRLGCHRRTTHWAGHPSHNTCTWANCPASNRLLAKAPCLWYTPCACTARSGQNRAH